MDFKDALLEAYRKKEKNGRYEFNNGKKTSIITNPHYNDLTTYQFDPTAKPKKKKETSQKLLEEVVDVFKSMLSKIAANTVNQAIQKNPHMSQDKYNQLKAQTTQDLNNIPTDQIVTQYSNMLNEPTAVQQKDQEEQDEEQALANGEPYNDPNASTNFVNNRL